MDHDDSVRRARRNASFLGAPEERQKISRFKPEHIEFAYGVVVSIVAIAMALLVWCGLILFTRWVWLCL